MGRRSSSQEPSKCRNRKKQHSPSGPSSLEGSNKQEKVFLFPFAQGLFTAQCLPSVPLPPNWCIRGDIVPCTLLVVVDFPSLMASHLSPATLSLSRLRQPIRISEIVSLLQPTG
ncbi:hypothetical protein K1719_015143 [Acacia pycnantha]|nr:hypothetical protein K1719_015143 [Acacia pycnantha]